MLTEGFSQITEEFKTWVNGDFKQLTTKTETLVVDSETLLATIEACVKLSDELVVLTARGLELLEEALLKVEK